MVVCKQDCMVQVRVTFHLKVNIVGVEDQDRDNKEVYEHISETEESKDTKVVTRIRDFEDVVVYVIEEGKGVGVDSLDFEIIKMEESYNSGVKDVIKTWLSEKM